MWKVSLNEKMDLYGNIANVKTPVRGKDGLRRDALTQAGRIILEMVIQQ